MGVQYFCLIWSYARINWGGVKFTLSCFCCFLFFPTLFFFLPCRTPSNADYDAITCPFLQGGKPSPPRSNSRGLFLVQASSPISPSSFHLMYLSLFCRHLCPCQKPTCRLMYRYPSSCLAQLPPSYLCHPIMFSL